MLIHIVAAGDTLYQIARTYQLSVARIISDNGLLYPYKLVSGQALIITQAALVHTVIAGDSTYSIAIEYDISVQELYQNNPELADRNPLYPGQMLVIAFQDEKLRSIGVNGYAYPFVDRHVLRRTLPYLSYLSIFSYGMREDGSLIYPDDEELLRYARMYQAAPILVLTSVDESGTFSPTITSKLLEDLNFQNEILKQLIAVMLQKGYRGLDSDFEFIPAEQAAAYVAFLKNASRQLKDAGLFLHCALAPKTSADQSGLLYEGHRYREIGEVADKVLLMTYEWGYT